MRLNPRLIMEKLDDGSSVLLDPEIEEIMILNRSGTIALITALNNETETALEKYLKEIDVSLSDQYLEDYNLFMLQLHDDKIILEDE